MARSYAKLHVHAWSDPEWVALDPLDKLVYLFLLSQPKMRSCGVVDMQARRWAPRLNISPESLAESLSRLVDLDYIALDLDTDELAVRTFVKHDAGDTKNWKVWIGVWSSLDAVESDFLREYVAFNMPDAAYEPKAKPSCIRPQSIPNRDVIDSQSIANPDPIDPETEGAESGRDDTETITNPIGNPIGNGIASGKSVTTSVSVTTTTTGANPQTHDQPDERPGGGTDQSTEAKITAALTAAADHEATVSELTGAEIGNPGGYRHRIAERLRTERGEQLRSMAEDPDATVADLTEFLTRPVPLNSLDDLVPGVGA
jgi:hypothetical protein